MNSHRYFPRRPESSKAKKSDDCRRPDSHPILANFSFILSLRNLPFAYAIYAWAAIL
jgi:hypothetical protein